MEIKLKPVDQPNPPPTASLPQPAPRAGWEQSFSADSSVREDLWDGLPPSESWDE